MPRLAQVCDHLPRVVARRRVEAGRGLVEEDEFWVADQRERYIEPAQLPTRELTGARLALPAEADELDRLRDRPRVGVVAGI